MAANQTVVSVRDARERAIAVLSDLFAKDELDLDSDHPRSDTDRPIAEVTSSSLSALRSYQSGLAELQQGENQAAIQLLKNHDFGIALQFGNYRS